MKLKNKGKQYISFVILSILINIPCRFFKVYLIDASSLKTLETDLKCIGEDLQTDDPIALLCTNPKEWLIVFDNVDDPELKLSNFIPRCNYGNIIITTRNKKIANSLGFYPILVSEMLPADALDLFCQLTLGYNNHTQDIEILLQELGYLVLAITHAATFIKYQENYTALTYLDLFRQEREHIIKWQSILDNNSDYPISVYATWDISYTQLKPLTQQFLQHCSYLHNQDISKDIFKKAFIFLQNNNNLSNDFLLQFQNSNSTWSDLIFDDIILELSSYSLIYCVELFIYSLHPLVHSFLKNIKKDSNICQSVQQVLQAFCRSLHWSDTKSIYTICLHLDLQNIENQDIETQYIFGQQYHWADQYQRSLDIQQLALDQYNEEIKMNLDFEDPNLELKLNIKSEIA